MGYVREFSFKIRNKHTGEIRDIVSKVSGSGRIPIICGDCGGYLGTPPFDSGASETKYCDCWEPVVPKREGK